MNSNQQLWNLIQDYAKKYYDGQYTLIFDNDTWYFCFQLANLRLLGIQWCMASGETPEEAMQDGLERNIHFDYIEMMLD